ncbi:MAG: hypothetical protein AABP62_21895 [Planctomycetota bacterium]
MPNRFLTISDAEKFTGKSRSTLRRFIDGIVKADNSPDRPLLLPTIAEVIALREQSQPFSWRISEELLFNFSAKIDTFTINYAKLCQFLPAKVEPYASQAKEQLAPAFRLLLEEGIVGAINWTTGQHDALQLHVTRGDHLTGPSTSSKPSTAAPSATTGHTASHAGTTIPPEATTQPRSIVQPDLFDFVTTHEHTSSHSPAERLVQQFHTAWNGSSTMSDDSKGSRGQTASCSSGELTAAKECLNLYGFDLASHLLPKVVKRMRQQFPDAKTFGATRPYFTELHADHLKRQRIAETTQSAHLEEQLEAEKRHVDTESREFAHTTGRVCEDARRDSLQPRNPAGRPASDRGSIRRRDASPGQGLVRRLARVVQTFLSRRVSACGTSTARR